MGCGALQAALLREARGRRGGAGCGDDGARVGPVHGRVVQPTVPGAARAPPVMQVVF